MKEVIRESLQKIHTPAELGRWFDPLKLEFDADSNQLTVFFPHVHFEGWFSCQGKADFEACALSALHENYGKHARICYKSPETARPTAFFAAQKNVPRPADAEYSLDSFIANNKNEFPLAAAREVCNPHAQHTYNPFIVCGKSGTGKTHILRALAAELTELHGQDNIFSGNADTFAVALDKRGAQTFSQRHAAIVVDDMHRVAHNLPLQEKIVQIMDGCLDSRRQMVFACGGPPSSLEGITDGLRSRMEVGLVVELKEPDIDVRMRFAQGRCRQYGIRLERAHLLLLAQRCAQIRHLSGVILKVAAFQALAQRSMATADLENILRISGEDRQLTSEDIINAVAEHMGLSPDDILGGKRQPVYVRARQTAMFLCRELLGTSYPALGRFFGGKDHSTVIHSIRKIKQLMDSDKDAHHTVTELKKKCLAR